MGKKCLGVVAHGLYDVVRVGLPESLELNDIAESETWRASEMLNVL